MAFRIDRGVFKFYDTAKADYVSRFKIDDESGELVELNTSGEVVDGYLKTSGKAADSNLLDGVDSSAFLRSNTADTFTGTLTMGTQVALVANNYGRGVFGTYSATRYQHVWGMGSAYKLADDGTSTGNLYGIAWTHSNIGGESISGLGHQMLIMSNGDTRTAIGDGIWTKYNITTTANSYAVDFDGTNFKVGNAVYFGGGNNYLNWTNSKVYSNVGIQSAGGFFDRLGNKAATYRHSGSDFADGTLVTTDIPATATSGASFIIEVIGKSYSSNPPFKFIAQGYLYNGTIINYSGQHFGYAGFSQLKVFKHTDGNLAFWWQRVSYWNSFEVRVIDAGGSSENRVVGIANSREIDSDKKVTITMKSSATEDWVDTNFLRTGEKAVDSAKADVARDLGSTYTADTWFRATSDNKTVKFYGNSRMMVFRTDGEGGDTGHTGYAFKWTYGGDGTSNTRMLLDNNGNLWTSSYGWLHSKFDTAGTASTLVDAAKEDLLNGAIATAQTTADNAATAAAAAQTTANTAIDRADGTKTAVTDLANSLGTAAYTDSTAYAAASHSHYKLDNSTGSGYSLVYDHSNEFNAYDNTGASTRMYLNYRGGEVYVEGANQVIHSGNIGSQSVSGAAISNAVSITGYSSGAFSFFQGSGTFAGHTGWANYFIGNHGNGSSYYNTTHIMPFWGPPQYSRLEGGTFRGPYTYWTTENFDPATKESAGAAADVLSELEPRISTAQTTADNAATAAATAQTTATTAETRANETKQALTDLGTSLGTAAYAATGDFLGATAKAADSEKVDGYDSGLLWRRVSGTNGTAGAGWVTIAHAGQGGRYSGEIIVTDGESSDHSFIRIHWMRSYADSNFVVLNCGGHSNRITGARVLYQTSDDTYGWKYLQVYVTTSSNYYVRVTKEGDTPNFSNITAVAPVVENSKSGYAVHGAELTGLEHASLAAEEGIKVGGTIYTNSHGNSSNWNTAYNWGNHATAGYLASTGKAADADKLDGYDWMQSGKSVRANEFYADNWFRNYNSNEGLYNEATGQHWYSDDDDYWNIAGGTAANGIRFRDEHAGKDLFIDRSILSTDRISTISLELLKSFVE
jgi:hypothetical protein